MGFLTKKLAISHRLLLGVYGIVPLCILVVFADILFFGAASRPYFSLTLMGAFLYLLFFELPHIIASFISYADKEYLLFYKKRLWWQVPTIFLITAGLVYIDLSFAITLYIIYTMYHVIGQQTGISAMLLRGGHPLHQAWKAVAVAFGSLGYTTLLFPAIVTEIFGQYGPLALGGSIGIFFLISLYILVRLAPGVGRQYFLATSAMILTSYAFLILGYLFLALFVVRFVHDITAFIFYMAHDHNRNFEEHKNYVFKLLAPFKVPVLFLAPLLGILLAYTIQFNDGIYATSVSTALAIGFVHYYLEGFMWKRDSLHRAQLQLAP